MKEPAVSEVKECMKLCIKRVTDAYPDCTECKYYLKDPDCTMMLMKDALSWLEKLADKALPRVLTMKELIDLQPGDVVWREVRYHPYDNAESFTHEFDPVMRDSSQDDYAPAEFLVVWNGYDDLGDPMLLDAMEDGSQMRYWSAKPTEEQWRDEPWKI